MIIQPKTRGFICTTAHPEGCAGQIQEQIDYVRSQKKLTGPVNVLVIGASTGYGLASRIAAAFGAGANTIGVFFDKAAEGTRTASAGWYNSAAFEREAAKQGLKSFSIVGDAFSNEIKTKTIELIKAEFGTVDLVVYSVASPRRTHPVTGEVFSSVIKPVGQAYSNKTMNFHTGEVSTVTIEPATEDEVRQTIAVMGGRLGHVDQPDAGGRCACSRSNYRSVLLYRTQDYTSYLQGWNHRPGEESFGADRHCLERAALRHRRRAFVSVNKALVTQSSSAIPVVPLYISALYRVMKEKELHENCIQQMYRLFADHLYNGGEAAADGSHLIRIDDWEMREDVQIEVMRRWNELETDNVPELADLAGYQDDFFHLFGFRTEGVDYEAETDPAVEIPNMV